MLGKNGATHFLSKGIICLRLLVNITVEHSTRKRVRCGLVAGMRRPLPCLMARGIANYGLFTARVQKESGLQSKRTTYISSCTMRRLREKEGGGRRERGKKEEGGVDIERLQGVTQGSRGITRNHSNRECCGNIGWSEGTRYEEVIDCLRGTEHSSLSQREGAESPDYLLFGSETKRSSEQYNNKKKSDERNARRYLQ